MAEAKTKATEASVDEYLASRASAEQLSDCKALMAMFKRVTKQPAKMWGPSIVGYGSYRSLVEAPNAMITREERIRRLPVATSLFCLISSALSVVSLTYHRLDLTWRALHSTDAFRSSAFWRLVVPATLLHSSWHHFLPNVIVGVLLGAAVERRMGSAALFTFLLVTSVVPTGIELLASNRPQIGISGVDYALLGVLLLNPPAIRRSFWVPFAMGLLVWLVAGIMFPILPDNPPGNFSHSTGLLLGLVLGFIFRRSGHAEGSAPNPALAPDGLRHR